MVDQLRPPTVAQWLARYKARMVERGVPEDVAQAAVEAARPPHWTCKTHGDFDAMVAVGCPECMKLARESLQNISRGAVRTCPEILDGHQTGKLHHCTDYAAIEIAIGALAGENSPLEPRETTGCNCPEVCKVCGGRAKACALLGHRPEADRSVKWFVVTDRMQGVDCPHCEDGTPHLHAPPGSSEEPTPQPEKIGYQTWDDVLGWVPCEGEPEKASERPCSKCRAVNVHNLDHCANCGSPLNGSEEQK